MLKFIVAFKIRKSLKTIYTFWFIFDEFYGRIEDLISE